MFCLYFFPVTFFLLFFLCALCWMLTKADHISFLAFVENKQPNEQQKP